MAKLAHVNLLNFLIWCSLSRSQSLSFRIVILMKCRNVSCAKYIVTISGAVALLDCRRRHRFERQFDLQTVGNSTEAAADIRVMGNSQGPRLNYGDPGCSKSSRTIAPAKKRADPHFRYNGCRKQLAVPAPRDTHDAG